MTYTGTDQPTKKAGPRLVVAIIVIIIGTITGIGGLAAGITSAVHDVRGIATGISPGTVSRHLDTGTWEVYGGDGSGEFQPSDVTVTGSDGTQIPTRPLGNNTTQSRTSGGVSYDGEVEFTISRAGQYRVHVGGEPGTPYLLSKSFGDVVKHAALWFVVMGFGILIGIIGVVLLIVGIVRRRNRRYPSMQGGGYQVASFGGSGIPPAPGQPGQPGQPVGQPVAQPAANQPPAAWYPDPSIAGSSRWWDGTRWTDQTRTP
jgi:Protein of unknown function (DUF2510)